MIPPDGFVPLATLWALVAIVAIVLVLKEKGFRFRLHIMLTVVVAVCSLLGRQE